MVAEGERKIRVVMDYDPQDTVKPVGFRIFGTDNVVRFVSCLIMGAAVSYPEDYEQMIIEGCNTELCEALNECLAEKFAELNTKLDAIDANTDMIAGIVSSIQTLTDLTYGISDVVKDDNQVAQPKPLDNKQFNNNACSGAYMAGGAASAMEFVNQMIIDVFEKSEVSAPDNAAELVDIIYGAVPFLETLPVDELFELVNYYFENQQTEYEADYDFAFQINVACDLACRVKDNNCIIDHIVIQQWFDWIAGAYTSNRAGMVFGRFGTAAKNGFAAQLQQGLNVLNGGESLAAFYDRIIGAFGLGARNENEFIWEECDCEPITEWSVDPNACLPEVSSMGDISVYTDSQGTWVEVVGKDMKNGQYGASLRKGGAAFTVYAFVQFNSLLPSVTRFRNNSNECVNPFPNPVFPATVRSIAWKRGYGGNPYMGFRIRITP